MDSNSDSYGSVSALRIPFVNAALNIHCALNGLQRTVEFNEKSVAGRLDLSALMHPHERSN